MYKLASATIDFEVNGESITPVKTFVDADGKRAQLIKTSDSVALYLEGLDGNYKPTAFWPKEILKSLLDKGA